MAHEATKTADKKINFLESAHGVVLKTCTVEQGTTAADEQGNKVIKAGTVYPANDDTALGIIYSDVDVTNGDHEASLMVAGRVYKDCLAEELDADAETALEAIGFKFFETTGVVRPAEEVPVI